MTRQDEAAPRRRLWLDLRRVPLTHRLPYLRLAQRGVCDAVLLDAGDPHTGREDIPLRVVEGDRLLRGGRAVGRLVAVRDKAAECVAAGVEGTLVVDGDEKVVPLENLIAARHGRGPTFAVARGVEEAARHVATLDVGVDGVLLVPKDPAAVTRVRAVLDAAPARSGAPPAPAPAQAAAAVAPRLVTATVSAVSDAGSGDRTCLDTTSLLRDGQGLLVGSTARSFCLVQAETRDMGHVPPRPFRINAGALHMYLWDGDRTRYLSEPGAGDTVQVVDRDGAVTACLVGRAKIERRPLRMVRWDGPGGPGMAIVQTAETVCLLGPDGAPVPVTGLRPGDAILVHEETAARHAGVAVDADATER